MEEIILKIGYNERTVGKNVCNRNALPMILAMIMLVVVIQNLRTVVSDLSARPRSRVSHIIDVNRGTHKLTYDGNREILFLKHEWNTKMGTCKITF